MRLYIYITLCRGDGRVIVNIGGGGGSIGKIFNAPVCRSYVRTYKRMYMLLLHIFFDLFLNLATLNVYSDNSSINNH